jgi:uncharacterized protein (TIGR00255 family)
MPTGFEEMEAEVRRRIAASLKRGNISATLAMMWSAGQQRVQIDTGILDHVLALVPHIANRLGNLTPPSVDGLLGLRGVIEVLEPTPTGEMRQTLDAEMLASLDQALATLLAIRRAEGDRLAAVLREQLQHVDVLCNQARKLASTQPEAIFARLKEQIAVLLAESSMLTPERLAQEAALLATKADCREELDRLCAHQQAARALLDSSGAVGRQLDFLCQELNREANTLCAKSSDIELTRVGLDLKAVIEQVREQVQNIE